MFHADNAPAMTNLESLGSVAEVLPDTCGKPLPWCLQEETKVPVIEPRMSTLYAVTSQEKYLHVTYMHARIRRYPLTGVLSLRFLLPGPRYVMLRSEIKPGYALQSNI